MGLHNETNARRKLLVFVVTLAACVALGLGIYRWSTSDLAPPARVVIRPTIESAEPGAGAPGATTSPNAVDPGPKPWETVGVDKKLAHLVEQHEPLWRSSAQLTFVPVENHQAVRDAMRVHWQGARFIRLQGRGGRSPEADVRRAMGDLTQQTLRYLSHDVKSFHDVSESYLENRRFREDPMPQWLFDSYVFAFDSKQPFESNDEASKRKVMEDFFNVRREKENAGFLLTHVASSPDGFVGAFYWLGSPNDSKFRLSELLGREGKTEYWLGGISGGAHFLTEGQPSLAERLRNGGDVLWAEAYFIVRTANNDRLPIRVGAYYDPADKAWHLAEMNFQSSPVFGSGSPGIIM
jgi:hypothetical protein